MTNSQVLKSAGTKTRPFSMRSSVWVYRISCIALAALVTVQVREWTAAITADTLRTNLSAVASASGTLLGFMISAVALLYAVVNTRLVRNLQRTGHFDRVLQNLFIDAAMFLVSLLASLATMFAPGPEDKAPMLGTLMGNCLLGATFITTLAYLFLMPVGRSLWVMLTHLGPPDPGLLE